MPPKKKAQQKSKSTKANAKATNTTKVTVNVGNASRPKARPRARKAPAPAAGGLFQPSVQVFNGHQANTHALESIRGELSRLQDKIKPEIRVAPPPELSYNYEDIKPPAAMRFHDNPVWAEAHPLASKVESVRKAASEMGPIARAHAVVKDLRIKFGSMLPAPAASISGTTDIMEMAARPKPIGDKPIQEARLKAIEKMKKYGVLPEDADVYSIGGLRENGLRGYKAAQIKVAAAKKNV